MTASAVGYLCAFFKGGGGGSSNNFWGKISSFTAVNDPNESRSKLNNDNDPIGEHDFGKVDFNDISGKLRRGFRVFVSGFDGRDRYLLTVIMADEY